MFEISLLQLALLILACLILGGLVGFFTACLCAAAGRADEQIG